MRPTTLWLGMMIVALGSLGAGYLAGARDGGRFVFLSGDMYEATLAAHRDHSLVAQGAALASIFAAATPADLDGITRAYETIHSGSGPSPLANELLGELWARYDPAAGLARAKGWDPYWYREFVPQLMKGWAHHDDRAAQKAATALAGELLRAEAEQAVAIGRFEARGDQSWAEYQASWPAGSGALPELLARRARRDGLEGLMQFVDGLPAEPPAFSARAIRLVVGLGGRIDPHKTAPWVEKQLAAPREDLRNLIAPFVSGWSERDPEAALEWLMTRPPGSVRDVGTRAALQDWALDPSTRSEAIAWFEKQPAEVLAPVIDLYAQALAPIDSTRALEAALRIENPALRSQILAIVKSQAARR